MFGTNQGLSPKGLEFAFLARDLAEGPLDYKIENFIHEYLNSVFQKDFFSNYGLFESSERIKFLKHFQVDNEKLAKRYISKKILFEDSVDIPQEQTEITLEDLVKSFMAMGIKIKGKIDLLTKS